MEKLDKQSHGLTDMQEGEFILNESGTFITTDQVEQAQRTRKEKNEMEQHKENEETIIISSSGPEEKDITD